MCNIRCTDNAKLVKMSQLPRSSSNGSGMESEHIIPMKVDDCEDSLKDRINSLASDFRSRFNTKAEFIVRVPGRLVSP